MGRSSHPYAILAKPSGPVCNLACRYCFYLEKKRLFGEHSAFVMPPDVLEAFIQQYIATQDIPEIGFSWQGGEPTLLGPEFFSRVVELQKKYADGKEITNAIQTNGTLLDDGWGEFLARNNFLVGLSLDGPRELHDLYRVDRQGHPTFDRVMSGAAKLKKHGVKFNILTVVNDANSRRPLEVYRFLKSIGDGFIQFIPLVERHPGKEVRELGLELQTPPLPGEPEAEVSVTPASVRPGQLAEFYFRIFDEWVRQDVGRVFVQFFDVALANLMGLGAGLCQFAPTCGHAGALEHNGDLYACDHYVYPRYRLGNILDRPLGELMDSAGQRRFGLAKRDSLPMECLDCEVRFACNGDCPKHRFKKTAAGEGTLSYLCSAYKLIFKHMSPFMRVMANLLASGREAAGVMAWAKEESRRERLRSISRNDPCVCGSGKKYKKCCGALMPFR